MPAFTTSRKPCGRTRTFIKELARVIPNSIVFGRGKQSIDEVAEHSRQEGYDRVAVVTEMHGNPKTIRVLSVDESDWKWIAEFDFKSVKLSRDFNERVKKSEHLSFETKSKFALALGLIPEESETLLKETKESLTFFQNEKEVGPRMIFRSRK